MCDHPALQSRPCEDVLLKDSSKETLKDEVIKLTVDFDQPLSGKEPSNVEEEENDDDIDTDLEETWEYETVYEKEELVGAIDEWMTKISDISKVPWTDRDVMDSFPVLRNSIKLDPFHQFDWSQGGRSHTGRLV